MDVQCDADINNTKTLIRFYPDIKKCTSDHLTCRGGGGGGYGFFSKKNHSDSQCCWKKYSDFGGGKENNVIQSFCHIT